MKKMTYFFLISGKGEREKILKKITFSTYITTASKHIIKIALNKDFYAYVYIGFLFQYAFLEIFKMFSKNTT